MCDGKCWHIQIIMSSFVQFCICLAKDMENSWTCANFFNNDSIGGESIKGYSLQNWSCDMRNIATKVMKKIHSYFLFFYNPQQWWQQQHVSAICTMEYGWVSNCLPFFLCALKQIFLTWELLKPALLQLLRIYWYIFNRRPVENNCAVFEWMLLRKHLYLSKYENESSIVWEYFCRKCWQKHVIWFRCSHYSNVFIDAVINWNVFKPFSFGEFPISIVPAAFGRRTEQMHIRYTTLLYISRRWLNERILRLVYCFWIIINDFNIQWNSWIRIYLQFTICVQPYVYLHNTR